MISIYIFVGIVSIALIFKFVNFIIAKKIDKSNYQVGGYSAKPKFDIVSGVEQDLKIKNAKIQENQERLKLKESGLNSVQIANLMEKQKIDSKHSQDKVWTKLKPKQ